MKQAFPHFFIRALDLSSHAYMDSFVSPIWKNVMRDWIESMPATYLLPMQSKQGESASVGDTCAG